MAKRIIITISIVIVLGLSATVFLIPDVKNGVVHTIQDTLRDTGTFFRWVGKEDVETPDTTPNENIPSNEEPNVEGHENTDVETEPSEDPSNDGIKEEPKVTVDGNLQIHILGTKGDSVLIVDGGEAILINGSYGEDVAYIQNYIKKLELEGVLYTIAINYHKASIEGLSEILSYLPSKYIFLAENIVNHEEGRNLMESLDSKKLVWSYPSNKGVYTIGDTTVQLLSTHYLGSRVVLVTNGNSNFLLTGTTAKFTEPIFKVLPSNVDVWYINGGTGIYNFPQKVYDAINPKNVVLGSVADVDLTHIERQIKSKEVVLYKSSDIGDIVINSDGENISFSVDE